MENEVKENNNVEIKEEKQKSNKFLIIALILIILVLVGYIVYDKFISKENQSKIQDNNIVEKEKNNISNFTLMKDQYYKTKRINEDDEIATILFRNDGTYIYSGKSMCGNNTVGTYEINDEAVILTKKVYYGCDACYYNITNDNIKDVAGGIFENEELTDIVVIKDNNTIEYEGMTFNLTTDFEEDYSKPKYVLNPIDGEIPEGWGDSWVDCTNLIGK